MPFKILAVDDEISRLSRSKFHGIGKAGAVISQMEPYRLSTAETMNRAKRASVNRLVSSRRCPRRGTWV